MIGDGGAVPGAQAATGGLMKVVGKFIVPIAGFAGGYMVGGPIVEGLAAWIKDFIPGMKRITGWAESRSSSTKIATLIAGAIVITVGVIVGTLIRGFLGGNFFGTMIATGFSAFTIGAGVKGIISGFGPLQTAVTTVSGGTA